MTRPSLSDRSSGVLLHLTSLPGPHGNGDLGPAALRFADFLARTGQRFWQMLPVGPAGFGNSPYSAHSSFAGDPLLISPTILQREGLLEPRDLESGGRLPRARVDYRTARAHRHRLLRKAFAAFGRTSKDRKKLEVFERESGEWLPDYALFSAIKHRSGLVEWTRWDEPLRRREPAALAAARSALSEEIAFETFVQWQFARQFSALKAHCARLGVGLIGDLPIFVAHDSADVWANPRLFKLDPSGMPSVVAGVPPDYFSRSGQRWGNPLYRWAAHRAEGYRYWIARMGAALARFDAVRLDHFIGFVRAYEIPASHRSAVHGRWVPGPGAEVLLALRAALEDRREPSAKDEPLPLIAEDLGVVTPDVLALRDRFGLPGLRILQFAFGNDPCAEGFLPHNYQRRAVVYTGTHDNDTCQGWFTERGGEGTRRPRQIRRERAYALSYLASDGREIHWDMIRAALMSVANLSVIPLQDVLGLPSQARMNRPGTRSGNWEWRFGSRDLAGPCAERLPSLTRLYGRAGGRGLAR